MYISYMTYQTSKEVNGRIEKKYLQTHKTIHSLQQMELGFHWLNQAMGPENLS